ncbi:MAG: DUF1553 domain-containing protein [Planctomycetaceae bacterium]|nr:DUF1553 domain-containing protein [Planctomycetaceae bacterium]
MKLSIGIFVACCVSASFAQADDSVSFNRQIRPILSESCLACHGFDPKHRAAGLRLDTFAGATEVRDGSQAVVPGDPARSELWRRITADDPDTAMPPADSHKPRLTAAQRELIKRWIEQGAAYERHWAFEPLRGDIPSERAGADGNSEFANPIDRFVAARLREKGLALAPEAERTTLLRRVSLDLTGLPPPPELLALPYEQAVDRLLASPHFGEHLAVGWLDAARYADTNGYFGDKPRQMWLWRDWVIDAFNSNMPYDRFTVEQLAGDLLPEATLPQRIATGFNRNHMTNNESGIIDEEFRVEYVVDRVHTTMTTWLGLTVGCAQCHDHKFDPISQREFYELFAFFNNVPEQGLIRADDPPPLVAVPSPEQEKALQAAAAESKSAAAAFAVLRKGLTARLAEWEREASATLPAPPANAVFHESFDGSLAPSRRAVGTPQVFEAGIRGQAAEFDATRHVEFDVPQFEPDRPWTIGFWLQAEGSLGCPLSWIEPDGDRRGLEAVWQKGRLQVNLVHRWSDGAIEVSTVEALTAKMWHQVTISYDGSRRAKGLHVYFDGRPTTLEVRRDTLDGTLANDEPLRVGRRDSGLGFYGRIDELRIVPEKLAPPAVAEWHRGERLRGIVETPAAKRAAADSDRLLDDYLEHFGDAETRRARLRMTSAARAEATLRAAVPTALVMQEMEQPRPTHVLERGQYDRPGELVGPDVPEAVAPWPTGAPRNRWGLARWLVSPENSLTPRVAVNRLWQHCFGEGLVRTVDDFGSQGEPPTHPELLDWLARRFREGGWDMKGMLRLIVTSRTYRQQSAVRVENDPDNRLLARGPSGRLSAEMLRDQALDLSGMLVRKIGGPSAKPYQPPGLWEAVSYNGEETYLPDTGDGLRRRGLYTYVKRQAPPPALLVFDGPTREKCTLRRARTNTPLQALVLLNDPTFVEAARELARSALASAGDDAARLSGLGRRVLLRELEADEAQLLAGLLARSRERFAADPAGAAELPAAGDGKHGERDACELAAWTVVAHTLLNLDEVVTKR